MIQVTDTNLANSQWPCGAAKSLNNAFTWRVVPAQTLTLAEKRTLYNKAKYQEKLAEQKAAKAIRDGAINADH